MCHVQHVITFDTVGTSFQFRHVHLNSVTTALHSLVFNVGESTSGIASMLKSIRSFDGRPRKYASWKGHTKETIRLSKQLNGRSWTGCQSPRLCTWSRPALKSRATRAVTRSSSHAPCETISTTYANFRRGGFGSNNSSSAQGARRTRTISTNSTKVASSPIGMRRRHLCGIGGVDALSQHETISGTEPG